MKISTTTRAALRAVALMCVLAGGVIAVEPAASADGDVIVTWPEMTSFNPDTTDYTIDVEWDASGSLWLEDMGTDQSLGLDELHRSGQIVVDFPAVDDGGARTLTLLHCPGPTWDGSCTVVSSSPTLDVTRDAGFHGTDPVASIAWPAVDELNPDESQYAPVVTWDGAGSLFVEGVSSDNHLGFEDEIEAPGPRPISFPDSVAGATWTLYLWACPARVLEWGTGGCREVDHSSPVDAWRSLGGYVGSPWTDEMRMGPDFQLPVTLQPSSLDDIDLSWDIVDAGVSMARGEMHGVPAAGPLPAIGEQPGLTDGHTYEFHATLSSDSPAFGHLDAAKSTEITWDDTNDADVRVETDKGHGLVETDSFYPYVDRFADRLEFRIDSTWADAGTADLTIRNADGAVVHQAEARYPGNDLTWKGLDERKRPVPPGSYTTEIALRDFAGNVHREVHQVKVGGEQLGRTIWRKTVTVDDSMTYQQQTDCGSLKRPARPQWPQSVGYYSPRSCTEGVVTHHEIRLPETIDGRYRAERISVVGVTAARAPRPASLEITYYRHMPYADPDEYFVSGTSLGTHSAPWQSDYEFTEDGSEGHYLTWSTGASRGSRYDVKKFVIEVRYDVLEPVS